MVAATKPPKPKRGEELELDVGDLAQGGRGVARLDGYVVFVAGGLPGDRVRARVDRRRRDFAEATAVEVLAPGEVRIPERCAHGGEPCPGAAWQALSYERQLTEKRRHARDDGARPGGSAASAGRCAGAAGSTDSSPSRSSRRSSNGVTGTSSSTPSARRTASPCSASTGAEAGARSSMPPAASLPRSE